MSLVGAYYRRHKNALSGFIVGGLGLNTKLFLDHLPYPTLILLDRTKVKRKKKRTVKDLTSLLSRYNLQQSMFAPLSKLGSGGWEHT